MQRRRVLVLAEVCNPEWPSLPIVGYKYAKALTRYADVTLVTHVRNRPAMEAAGDMPASVHYIDTEWLAAPVHRLAHLLRGGDQVAWSVAAIMGYPSYLAFEFQAWRRFREQVWSGAFDLIHRITPMSPTTPSPIAKRAGVPFVIGPLNGNLDWPQDYRAEMQREKERMRALRPLYKVMPYTRSTQAQAACILAAFEHTRRDLRFARPDRVVSFPEIGYDPEIFNTRGRQPSFAHAGPYEFLFAGRLVPYKLAEAVVRAFAGSDLLRQHRLTIIGDGPERSRLIEMAAQAGAQGAIDFAGQKTQQEVADAMRRADAFVFPSIRELGAGVVIEAMACGAMNLVVDYGAPGALVGKTRGVAVPLQRLDSLVASLRARMEDCARYPQNYSRLALAGADYAQANFTWDKKACHTAAVYEAVLAGRPLSELSPYD